MAELKAQQAIDSRNKVKRSPRPLSARQVQDEINKEERCFDTFKLCALFVVFVSSVYLWSRTGYAGLDDLLSGNWR